MSNLLTKLKAYAKVFFTYEPTTESDLEPANHGKPWTLSEIEDLTTLFESGMAIEDIASLFDRTPSAVYQKLQQTKNQSK